MSLNPNKVCPIIINDFGTIVRVIPSSSNILFSKNDNFTFCYLVFSMFRKDAEQILSYHLNIQGDLKPLSYEDEDWIQGIIAELGVDASLKKITLPDKESGCDESLYSIISLTVNKILKEFKLLYFKNEEEFNSTDSIESINDGFRKALWNVKIDYYLKPFFSNLISKNLWPLKKVGSSFEKLDFEEFKSTFLRTIPRPLTSYDFYDLIPSLKDFYSFEDLLSEIYKQYEFNHLNDLKEVINSALDSLKQQRQELITDTINELYDTYEAIGICPVDNNGASLTKQETIDLVLKEDGCCDMNKSKIADLKHSLVALSRFGPEYDMETTAHIYQTLIRGLLGSRTR